MRQMLARSFAAAALLACLCPPAFAGDAVPGQKVDSDLGNLPPFTQWDRHPQLRRYVRIARPRVAGEKLDSGVGDLPPYSQWHRHPELSPLLSLAPAQSGRSAAGKLTQVAAVRD